ncbi:MAG: hypothetical protein Q8O56_06235 [Solirubrobacteraceae bacterium]|nr:hypothetical protein [Solirubrobacteraceae bacterium]
MTSSLGQRRFVAYRSVPREDAIVGYNMASGFTDLTQLQMLADMGGTIARVHNGWNAIENVDTGELSLSAPIAVALDKCAEFGIKPFMVAGYSIPYKQISRPLLTRAAPRGSYVLHVDSTAGIDPPFCLLQKYNSVRITALGKWTYSGSFIHAVDHDAGTIELASATVVDLDNGAEMQVNRMRHASLPDKNPDHPTVAAFVRLCEFLAGEIAARGVGGYVGVWNEPPWTNDRSDNRAAWYDVVPSGLVLDTRLTAFVRGCLASRPPDGVRYVNCGPAKSAGSGLLSPSIFDPPPTATEIREAVSWESMHPYHKNPEGFHWDPSGTDGAGYWALTPEDVGGNFRLLKFRADTYAAAKGVAPRPMSTECGSGNPTGVGDHASAAGHSARARYTVRRVVSSWGCGVPCVLYAFGAGTVYDIISRTTYEPHPPYLALQRLMAMVQSVGPTASARWLPALVGVGNGEWPPMFAGVHGEDGAILFGWQRTFCPEGNVEPWGLIPHPDPVNVQVRLPTGSTVADCVNVVTGVAVPTAVAGRNVTWPITDEVVALRVTAPA